MAIRLKDIARELGVSTVTVSKALRGNRDISEETRQRILKRMKELNYQPNIMARGLASGKTYTVGLVVPDLVHPFFAEIAKAISGVVRENGRALVVASSEEDPEIEHQEIRALLQRGVDVLLIASCQPKLRHFYELGDERTPFLLIDRNYPYLAAHFVGSDDYRVGQVATEHLIDLGRKRIAHISGRVRISPVFDRMRGYRDTIVERGLPFAEELIVACDRFEESGDSAGYQAMQQLLSLPERPDAVFCYNDLTAVGAMEAALDAGLSIPDQIAFVGCGNFRYARYLRVPLTSVDQGPAGLGRTAGRLAQQLIKDPEMEPQTVLQEPTVVARASTRRA